MDNTHVRDYDYTSIIVDSNIYLISSSSNKEYKEPKNVDVNKKRGKRW